MHLRFFFKAQLKGALSLYHAMCVFAKRRGTEEQSFEAALTVVNPENMQVDPTEAPSSPPSCRRTCSVPGLGFFMSSFAFPVSRSFSHLNPQR